MIQVDGADPAGLASFPRTYRRGLHEARLALFSRTSGDADVDSRTPSGTQGSSLLLVTECEVLARSLIAALERASVRTEWARTLAEATSRARAAGHETPRIVFLDLEFPHTTDEEAVKLIRQACPLAAVIALGEGLEGERATRLLAFGVPSIKKPLCSNALASLAQRLTMAADESGSRETAISPLAPEWPKGPIGNLEQVIESYAAKRTLSRQQRLILKLYLRGGNDKEIAADCNCSEATIYEHWRRMAKKAGGSQKGCVITDFHRFLGGE
jgi:DNA-binding NarL/FixJ family response regulator